MMKGLVIVPAFNEEVVIIDVLSKIPRQVLGHQLEVVVVNDGSSDATEKLVKKAKHKIISHPVNRGLGAALGTGMEYARLQKKDFLITLDGDGQHDPVEISKLLRPIIKGEADFVVGSRVSRKGMPLVRKVLSFLASIATYFFTSVWTTDSQSGFRAFSKKAIQEIIIEVDRMEVSTEFFRQSRQKKLKIKEVSVKPIYTEYSLRKGQSILNSVNILGKLTLKKIVD